MVYIISILKHRDGEVVSTNSPVQKHDGQKQKKLIELFRLESPTHHRGLHDKRNPYHSCTSKMFYIRRIVIVSLLGKR